MKAKILIVDDSGLARRRARTILEAAGFDVSEAEDGISALERYFVTKPDLVLLDLVMKGMYGLDVLAKLREMDPHARIIVISADVQTSSHTMVTEAGAAAFMVKPFDADEMVATVQSTLSGAL
jgi:two-component system chemotaxis response regulator CheY